MSEEDMIIVPTLEIFSHAASTAGDGGWRYMGVSEMFFGAKREPENVVSWRGRGRDDRIGAAWRQ